MQQIFVPNGDGDIYGPHGIHVDVASPGYKMVEVPISALPQTIPPTLRLTPPRLPTLGGLKFIRPEQECDTECYRNFWLIKFLTDPNGVVTKSFDMYPGKDLDRAGLEQHLRATKIFTFNGMHYDIPMITLALAGADCNALKEASDLIIKGNLKSWAFYRHFNLQELDYIDHVDIMEVAPGVRVSLKQYGGRMASRKLQDLPIHPDDLITPEQRIILSSYCDNDLLTTHDLKDKCKSSLALREKMSATYGIDLRSKSDAQCAEAIIKSQLGFTPQKAVWAHGTPFKFVAPAFIKFQTPQLQDALQMIQGLTFYTTDKDQVTDDAVDEQGKPIKTGIVIPDELKKLKIKMGTSAYTVRIGGLHSTESKAVHVANEHFTIKDRDVRSYYPTLKLICGLYPSQLGPRYLEIYRAIYNERLAAKDFAQKLESKIKEAVPGFNCSELELQEFKAQLEDAQTEADAKKIVLNGAYGKLGSKYSILFAPDLMLTVTLTGQLALLMLIESLELAGISVVSANTDGIVIKTPTGREFMRDQIVKHWEFKTGLETEDTDYAALYSRDVNNYIAFKLDGKHKAKGAFAKTGLTKNPTCSICIDAVVEYLGRGTPIEKTIYECRDVKQFLTVRNAKGGAVYGGTIVTTEQGKSMQGGVYLGKVVRWYYSTDEKGALHVLSSGNIVAKSEGGYPLMDLIDYIPANIDYKRYIDEAKEILSTLGL